jgi:hypothetical protein
MICRLYRGTVTHRRNAPLESGFVYPAAFVAIDLATLASGRSGIAYNRPGWLRLDDRDYLEADGRSIFEKIATRLPDAVPERTVLMTTPRGLLPGFNPLSCYFVLDEAGGVKRFAAEVANTYHERYLYVPDIRRGDDGRFTGEAPKAMYVSPFHGVKGIYRFAGRIAPAQAAISVTLEIDGRAVISAHMAGEGTDLAAASLRDRVRVGAFGMLAWPRIVLQALKLRARGLNPVMKPHPPAGALRRKRHP